MVIGGLLEVGLLKEIQFFTGNNEVSSACCLTDEYKCDQILVLSALEVSGRARGG